MSDQTLQDLPLRVRDLILATLQIFVDEGPRGLATRGLFPEDQVAVADERCADFGSKFRIPPAGAIVYAYRHDDCYDVELPLWLQGEDDRCDLFIFLEVNPAVGIARMWDLRVP